MGYEFKLAGGLILKTNFVTVATVAAHILQWAGMATVLRIPYALMVRGGDLYS
jgi:hypothetical protein